jgi:hypothetical protein
MSSSILMHWFCSLRRTQKKIIFTKATHGRMVTEKEFSCRNQNNWKFSIIKPTTTETCLLPFLRQLNIFGHHLCGDQIISITKLWWVLKTITCIPIQLFLWKSVGFVLFNKQWLPYTLERKGETFMSVWSFKLSHIAFAIGVEFHFVAFKVESNGIIIY